MLFEGCCCMFIIVLVILMCKTVSGRWRRPMLTDLEKKAVIITGCDSGFGLAATIHLDSLGVPVFAGCYTPEGVLRLEAKCSPILCPLSLDVSSPDSVKAAYTVVQDRLAKLPGVVLWGLINNAGILGNISAVDMLTPDDYQQVMQVNFHGLIQMTFTFLPLIKQSQGRLINVSSVSGFLPFDRFSPYTASKFAIRGFTDSIRMELKPWGVRACVIEPCWFSTDLAIGEKLAASFKDSWERCSDQVKTDYGRHYYEEVMWKLMQPTTYKLPTDLSPVVDAYVHGLYAVHPRSHYLVGRAWWLFLILGYYMPRVVTEWLVRRLPGSRRPLPKKLQPYREKLY